VKFFNYFFIINIFNKKIYRYRFFYIIFIFALFSYIWYQKFYRPIPKWNNDAVLSLVKDIFANKFKENDNILRHLGISNIKIEGIINSKESGFDKTDDKRFCMADLSIMTKTESTEKMEILKIIYFIHYRNSQEKNNGLFYVQVQIEN
jgi:hypothetical protein